ncbi:hypothetical protein AWENTII_000355 [Aspergillus wentii]
MKKPGENPVRIPMNNKELCECIQKSIDGKRDKREPGKTPGEDLPLDGLYVRLRPGHKADIGGFEHPDRGDVIYIPQANIDAWSRGVKWPTEKPKPTPTPTPTVINPDETAERDQPFFWARNEKGRAVLWNANLEPSSEPKKWKKWYEEAIVDREGLGLRWINPNIELYLVPVGDASIKLDVAIENTKRRLKMVDSNGKESTCQQTVKFSTDPPDGTEYRKLAKSPFGHYETWIKESDYKGYMARKPTRPFPDKGQISKALEELKSTGDPIPQSVQKTLKSPRKRFKPSPDRKPQSNIIINHVTRERIKAIAGTRTGPGVDDQKKVMGKSASEIAKLLKWENAAKKGKEQESEERWADSPYADAEWLHRSAYSWGNIVDGNNMSSPQVMRNFIFGTSECNSIMTRYETSWQKYIVQLGEDKNHKGGILEAAIKRDVYETDFADGNITTPQPELFTDTTCPGWLCCAMDYRLSVQGSPDIRNQNKVDPFKGPFATTFYPFQRGFFTKFEYFLDDEILRLEFPPRDNPTPGPSRPDTSLSLRPKPKNTRPPTRLRPR